jgi:NADH-quinone oxidoreductase subunit H
VEYFEALAFSAIITTLFLSGWKGPWLYPFIWFLIKVFIVFFMLIWVRSTVPRMRIDHVMGFAWKCLLPLALINLFITGLQVLIWPDGLPWVMIFVNLAIMAVLILLWSKFFKLGGGRVEV